MPTSRAILVLALGTLTLGSLAMTGGYAWYLRSAHYREVCAASVSEVLKLPVEIDAAVPRSRWLREFRGVRVLLPDASDVVLDCDRAELIDTPVAGDPGAYTLALAGGSWEVSTHTWRGSGYRGVVEAGRQSAFSERAPRRITLDDMVLRFEHDGLRLQLGDAGGVIDISPTEAEARVLARTLNATALDRPVLLVAQVLPAAGGARFDALELSVPAISLEALDLSPPLPEPITRGSFSGRLNYSEAPGGGTTLALSGRCATLDLQELTAGWAGHTLRGRCPEIELQELRVEDGRVRSLRFRGLLSEVALGDLLALGGLHDTTGIVDLDVGEAHLSTRGIERLLATGRGRGIDLGALTEAIGLGRMTGELRVEIANLVIEENRLVKLDLSAEVADAGEAPNVIEAKLLGELVSRVLGFRLPILRFLTGRLEYTRLGFRVEVRDEQMLVFGSHGPEGRAMITVLLEGREMQFNEPEGGYDLEPLLDHVRARLATTLKQVAPGSGAGGPVDDDTP